MECHQVSKCERSSDRQKRSPPNERHNQDVGFEDEEEDGMKEFMKIERVKFGAGGYDDAMFGFSFTLTGNGSGAGS